MSAILNVSDLRKSYAGVHALDGVSFAVEAGSITGLIGPNGSGKSTAIDCISGFQKLDSGKVVLADADITGRPLAFRVVTEQQLRAGLTQAGLPAGAVNIVVGIQASFAAGAFDIMTGDVERLGGRPPKPLRDVLAGALKSPSA